MVLGLHLAAAPGGWSVASALAALGALGLLGLFRGVPGATRARRRPVSGGTRR